MPAKSICDERTAIEVMDQIHYRFTPHAAPFDVSAIFTDGQFTYIRAEASELPALYEIRDGAPNLVTFQVERGTYIVPKVLDRGYLTIGAKRFSFETKEDGRHGDH
jgi:conjugative transfer protein CagX